MVLISIITLYALINDKVIKASYLVCGKLCKSSFVFTEILQMDGHKPFAAFEKFLKQLQNK